MTDDTVGGKPSLSGAAPGERIRQPERLSLDGRRPWPLDDCGRALQVVAGNVDIFALQITDGTGSGPRRHLFRVETGGIILGLPSTSDSHTGRVIMLAVGGPGSEVLVLPRERISDLPSIEAWVSQLGACMVDPTVDLTVRQAEGGAKYQLAGGERLGAPSLGVAWISVEKGEIRLLDAGSACRSSDPPLPLASGTWIQSQVGASVVARSGAALAPADLGRRSSSFTHLQCPALPAGLRQSPMRRRSSSPIEPRSTPHTPIGWSAIWLP